MSISPASDLILDVVRAADPQRAAAAARKLGEAAGAFGAELRAATKTTGAPALRPTFSALDDAATPARRANATGANRDPRAMLGALVLQKAVETMLPDGHSAIFGGKQAGAMWKSMLAEHIAAAVSPRVFAERTRTGDKV